MDNNSGRSTIFTAASFNSTNRPLHLIGDDQPDQAPFSRHIH